MEKTLPVCALTILLICSASGVSSAEDLGTVKFVALSAVGQRIERAQVFVTGPNASKTVNITSGRALIELPAGAYLFRCRSDGMYPVVRALQLIGRQAVDVVFVLQVRPTDEAIDESTQVGFEVEGQIEEKERRAEFVRVVGIESGEILDASITSQGKFHLRLRSPGRYFIYKKLVD